MRWGVGLILCAMSAGGCASQPTRLSNQAVEPLWQETSASILAYDPPVSRYSLFIDRSIRQPQAFAGYDSLTTTYTYIRTEDHFGDQWPRSYERRAVIHRVGVNYR